MSKENLEVEFACDDAGDHTANMQDCTSSQIKSFTSEEEKNEFIMSCTYVYNLDAHVGIEKSPYIPNPILDCIEEQIF